MISMDVERTENFNLYFYPKDSSDAGTQALLDREKGKPDEKMYLITEIAKKLRDSLESSGVKKWEIAVKGYLEASTGWWPGGKVGFEATLTLSNQP